jgi:hypothetical protein
MADHIEGWFMLALSRRRTVAVTDVRFSNRPFGVKHFQTIRRCSVDVTHGLVLLFGIGTRARPSWIRGRGGTIFWSALPSDDRRSQQSS